VNIITLDKCIFLFDGLDNLADIIFNLESKFFYNQIFYIKSKQK